MQIIAKPWMFRFLLNPDKTITVETPWFVAPRLLPHEIRSVLCSVLGWKRELVVVLSDVSLLPMIEDAFSVVRLLSGYCEPISMQAIAYIANWHSTRQLYSHKALKGLCRNGHMLLVGGGKSVLRDAQNIRQLSSQVFTVAAGSGVTRCREIGIVPDLVLLADPYSTEEHILDIEWPAGVSVPALATRHLNPNVWAEWKGPIMVMPGDQCSHVGEIIQPHAKPPVMGSGVTLWGMELAEFFGAKKCFLTGIDLCYAEDKSDVPDQAFLDSAGLLVIEQNGRATLPSLVSQKLEIENLAKKNPHTSYINTSNGLPLKGLFAMETPASIPSKVRKGEVKLLEVEIDTAAVLKQFRELSDMCFEWIPKIRNLTELPTELKKILQSHLKLADITTARTGDYNWSLLRMSLYEYGCAFRGDHSKLPFKEPDYLDRKHRPGMKYSISYKLDNKMEIVYNESTATLNP